MHLSINSAALFQTEDYLRTKLSLCGVVTVVHTVIYNYDVYTENWHISLCPGHSHYGIANHQCKSPSHWTMIL